MNAVSTWKRTLGASIVAFALGAGAATGGFVAYNHWASPSGTNQTSISQYATVAETPSTLPMGPDTISSVVKRDGKAVVQITSTIPASPNTQNPLYNNFFGNLFGGSPFGGTGFPIVPQTETAIGSGFIFNSQGDILTNDHVIYGATKILVTVPGYKKPFPATVVGSDYATDLAVVKINAPKPLPTLALGNSNATPVGAWAIAIGNPYGLNHTVTVGVISAKGRPLTIGSRHYRNLLQTSAAINPGNSGGPLLNLAGQVVGINTAVATQAQGIGFAIPTSTVDQILPQLMKNGHVIRPYLGIFMVSDTPALAQQYQLATGHGVVVDYVEPGSPASAAGLQQGDIITGVNGKSVDTAAQLKQVVDGTSPGSRLTLTVNRNHHILTIPVTIGQAPNGPITMP